jgi:hypothetical protein
MDETWTKTNVTRVYGWAPRGRRLVAKGPNGHWKTATLLAALRTTAPTRPASLTARETASGLAYVDQFLVPTIKRDGIVVLDNLGSQKG